jgi:cbb3-type cytochrome oxidase subunit 1
MPRLSCWFLRAALAHLCAGLTAGAVLLVVKGVGWWSGLWRLFPAHVELVLIGWTVQLALGVAFWIRPRLDAAGSRGNERPVWTAFWLLNTGVLLAGVAPVLGAPPAVRLLGQAAEAVAIVIFAWHAWGRIRPARTMAPAPAEAR